MNSESRVEIQVPTILGAAKEALHRKVNKPTRKFLPDRAYALHPRKATRISIGPQINQFTLARFTSILRSWWDSLALVMQNCIN